MVFSLTKKPTTGKIVWQQELKETANDQSFGPATDCVSKRFLPEKESKVVFSLQKVQKGYLKRAKINQEGTSYRSIHDRVAYIWYCFFERFLVIAFERWLLQKLFDQKVS